MADTLLGSRITAVTVFSAAALVTREAEIEPVDGGWPTVVEIFDLPLCLDDASLQVRVAGGDEPLVADVRVVLNVPPVDLRLAPPHDEELRAAARRVAHLKDRIAQEEASRARLERLAPPARPAGAPGEAPPPAPVEGRLALVEMRRSQLEAVAERLRELSRELVDASDLQAALEERRRKATTARQAREGELRKSAVVRLHVTAGAPAAAPRTLVVSYLVPGPRWLPAYTLRFDPSFAEVELGMRALLAQASGEDWAGVALTVSTADPSRWTDLPELPALKIGRRQATPARSGWREPPAGAGELYADYDRARTKALAEAPPATPPEPPMVEPSPVMDAEELTLDLTETADAGPVMAQGADERRAMAPLPPPAMPAMAPAPLAAPPRPVAAARTVMAKSEKARFRSDAAPGGGLADGALVGAGVAAAQPEPAGPLAAPAELLRYADLRLGAADEASRGSLRPVGATETYLELLTAMNVTVSCDVVAVVRAAVRRAATPASAALPAGYRAPEPWEGFDQAYRAEAAVDIVADGELHSVPLLSRRLPASLRHVAVPRESGEVFRFSSLPNPLHAALPEGPADVYVGPSFLLTSRMPVLAPDAFAEIGLGVDEAVRVARNVRFSEHSSGLLGGTLELSHEVTVEVANLQAVEVVVEVRERLPLAREGDKDVAVASVEATPQWEPFQQPDHPIEGGRRWIVKVAPGAKRELRASYTVTIPAKKELVGGNRREP